MSRLMLQSLIQLAVVLPIVFLSIKKYDKENVFLIMAFALIFLADQVVLNIPRIYTSLNIFHGTWNWTGKVFSIIFGIICYLLLKSKFAQHNFISFKQNKSKFKIAAIVSLAAIVATEIIVCCYPGKSAFNIESLAFQFTMPGIDEELMYRGIFLGLLL